MKKCPFCAEEIQDEAIKCRHCGSMLEEPRKWYYKTSALVTAFLLIGPFALPLLWINPRISSNTKIVVSVLVIIASIYLAIWTVKAVSSINSYYQTMFQALQ